MSTLYRSPGHLPTTRAFGPRSHRPSAQGSDLVTDLAASLFLSLFVNNVGAARPHVPVVDLHSVVASTGPRGVRAAGQDGAVLLSRWEQAGLIDPVSEAEATITLRPRGIALLAGPFRWDRLTRALSRHV